MAKPPTTMKTTGLFVCLLALASLLAGCAGAQKPHAAVAPANEGDLSSEWELQDEATFDTITLDRYGNGGYNWQNGRIETTSFSDGKWTGNWVQPGNDRQGGFELVLSPDRSLAQGTWWYTRIREKIIPPGEPGKEFKLKRVPMGTTIRPAS